MQEPEVRLAHFPKENAQKQEDREGVVTFSPCLVIIILWRYCMDEGEGRENGHEQQLRKQLWRCNCSDGGEHTDPERHESKCHYSIYYNDIYGEEE